MFRLYISRVIYSYVWLVKSTLRTMSVAILCGCVICERDETERVTRNPNAQNRNWNRLNPTPKPKCPKPKLKPAKPDTETQYPETETEYEYSASTENCAIIVSSGACS